MILSIITLASAVVLASLTYRIGRARGVDTVDRTVTGLAELGLAQRLVEERLDVLQDVANAANVYHYEFDHLINEDYPEREALRDTLREAQARHLVEPYPEA